MSTKKPSPAAFKLPGLPKPPPRTEVLPEAAKAFVPDERPPSKLRADSRGERLAIYLRPEILRRLRHRCVDDGRSLSDAINEAVARWLGEVP